MPDNPWGISPEQDESYRKRYDQAVEKLRTDPGEPDQQGRRPLHKRAIEGKHVDQGLSATTVAETLIASGADVNAKDNQGRTPLHLAATAEIRYRDFDLMNVLLAHGANVDARDNKGKTPLHLTAQPHSHGLLSAEVLLAHGADVNAKDDAGHTAYHYASRLGFGDDGTADLLYEHGGRDFGDDIHAVVADCDLDKVAALLKENPTLVSSKDADNLTPLHVAALRGHTAIAEMLLARGANSNARHGRDEPTPLFLAAVKGRTATVELLLAHGADVNAKYSDRTPLGSLPKSMPGRARGMEGGRESDRKRKELEKLLEKHGGRYSCP